jgi:osmotically inducible protein OsmC
VSLYEETATAWGGRTGHVKSATGKIDLYLSMPKAGGGDDGPGTNPEELFATGWAACFHSALKLVASQRKVDVADSAVSVTVGLTGGVADGFSLTGKIEAELPGVDPVVAKELVEAAHLVCPYSKATRGNIPVEVSAVTE